MTKNEALKLALEALNDLMPRDYDESHGRAWDAIKEALAEPDPIASMTKQTKALHLENKLDEFCDENGIDPLDPTRGLVTSAFRSGAQAVAESHCCGECDVSFPCYSGEQQCIRLLQQKPDAWQGVHIADKVGEPLPLFTSKQDANEWVRQYAKGYATLVPLYAHPPQRPWVGLTAAEFEQCYEALSEPIDDWTLGRAIEAKLREKNS